MVQTSQSVYKLNSHLTAACSKFNLQREIASLGKCASEAWHSPLSVIAPSPLPPAPPPPPPNPRPTCAPNLTEFNFNVSSSSHQGRFHLSAATHLFRSGGGGDCVNTLHVGFVRRPTHSLRPDGGRKDGGGRRRDGHCSRSCAPT